MTPISTSQQSPSPAEAEQTTKSAIQHNKTVGEAVANSLQESVQKNSSNFQDNLAVAAAQITGKGTALNVIS